MFQLAGPGPDLGVKDREEHGCLLHPEEAEETPQNNPVMYPTVSPGSPPSSSQESRGPGLREKKCWPSRVDRNAKAHLLRNSIQQTYRSSYQASFRHFGGCWECKLGKT